MVTPDKPYDTDVLYQPNVLRGCDKKDVNLAFVDRLLTDPSTKAGAMSRKSGCSSGLMTLPTRRGLRWVDFGPNLELKEVIIGSQCKPEDSDAVVEEVHTYGDSVKCWWAGMRPDAFLLVRLEGAPWWHADVHR